MSTSDIKENLGFWIVLLCIFSLLVGVWLLSPFVPVSSIDSVDSLLSLLAQIQASIFAIVISLTLVAVQLSSQKYSMRISRIFLKSWTFWGIILVYFASILFDVSAMAFLDLSLEQGVFIGVSLFLLTFVFLVVYIRKTIEVLSPENLVQLLLNSITLKEIEQYVENPTPLNDKFLPIKEFLNVAAKNGEFETIQVVTGGVIQKFGNEAFSGDTKDDPLWKYFEKLISVLSDEEQGIRNGSYSFNDYEELNERKRIIKEKIYLYLMCFLEIPNNILENAKKLRNLKLFYLGFLAFNNISLAFMNYLRQFIASINSTEQIKNQDFTKFMFKESMDTIINSAILYYISLHSKTFLRIYWEERPYDIYGTLMIYNSIIETYEVIGITCAELDLPSSLDTVADELFELTLSLLKICPMDIKEDILDVSIHSIGRIMDKILSTLKDPACSEEEIRDLEWSFNCYLSVLEELVKTSISAEIETSAKEGINVIAMPLQYIPELLKNEIKQPIRVSITKLSDILTNMQVDTSELKLKQSAAVYATKAGVLLLNTYVEELSKSCNIELLEFCLKEIDKIYKVAYEKYGFCWPYYERILLTSNTLVTLLETLINDCSEDVSGLIKTTSDILTSFVINLLQSSIEKDWDKIEKENRINSAKEVTEHLIYLGYILTKHEKLNYATDLSINLVKINQKAMELGFSDFVPSIFRKIKETKKIGIHKKTRGSVSISELWLKFLDDDLKTLEEFEKLYYSKIGR